MFFQFKEQLPHLAKYWDALMAMHQRIEVPAKTILLAEGEVSKKSFLIEKGCLRVWFNNNGKDTTFQFFFENEGLSSLESFRKNIPGMFSIETVEPCILHVLQKKDFDRMMDQLEQEPAVLKEMMNVVMERQLHYMKEFLSFIRDSPQERYLNLLREKPKLIQRVPQHYIASYLGITSVHLSRIKNKILKDRQI
ncbi:cAMP-binding domain of CRP or a regulatory subunit of cAMP-dependent protein kinases [Pedobacter steynii]|uniref:cAMP-binding domain of CRP or a regulatory subunit of cAMP-dependent protein kinases n=1 Tax=Pedobacter steynii TaxID=430522 RepID=A0A1G9NTP0_9SPHI|nr:Crp/Fnr family transcriptional regulator [Pedobacter steynii]NQX39203.1 Crp/Fnr family transcriptional regulator [Pedobacter steynii]SDL89397.1 cAMP-binding domain of CRP or a regulatory subunit of cAMP-dependent protein kinases [Pedobacter steynii]